MDSFQILELIINSEGKNIYHWNQLLKQLKENKEK